MSAQILHGDCIAIMRDMPEASVDAIVTDPPYHLTTGKRGGTGEASVSLATPHGRARVTTGFMGMKWDGGDVAMRPESWAAALRVLKPGGYLLAFSGTRTYHRMACAIEDAGFEIRDQIGWAFGSGFPKSHNGEWGGTALKPAWEPICMARKPLIGTVEANWRTHGTGALNIDGCRVLIDGEVRAPQTGKGGIPARHTEHEARAAGVVSQPHQLGRWPANLIHDGSDEVLAGFPQSQVSGSARKGTRSDATPEGIFGKLPQGRLHNDSGSAARFFYCAKASKRDRDEGLEGFQIRQTTGGGGGIGDYLSDVDSASGKFGSEKAPAKNHHPTVKPTNLMRYLCRLVTPAGGTVLDPFAGSGSTGKAAVLEGCNFIGIELEAEYVSIARARIAFTERRGHQPGLALEAA